MNAIVIGGGPAGVGAAVALRCEGIDTLLIAGTHKGFRGDFSPNIENIPGVQPASGNILLLRYYTQLQHFGVGYIHEQVTSLRQVNNLLTVTTKYSERIADAVVIATGMRLHADPALKPAQTYNIVVFGGGDAAVQCALGHAAKASNQVTLVVRGKDLGSCSAYLRTRLDASRVQVMFECRAELVGGAVVITDERPGGLTWKPKHACLQTLTGAEASTAWVHPAVARSASGHIITDAQFHTNLQGIFAAGDIRFGSIKRISIAQGEGTAAGHYAAAYLRRKAANGTP